MSAGDSVDRGFEFWREMVEIDAGTGQEEGHRLYLFGGGK